MLTGTQRSREGTQDGPGSSEAQWSHDIMHARTSIKPAETALNLERLLIPAFGSDAMQLISTQSLD